MLNYLATKLQDGWAVIVLTLKVIKPQQFLPMLQHIAVLNVDSMENFTFMPVWHCEQWHREINEGNLLAA